VGIAAVMADLHCRPGKRMQSPNQSGNHRGFADLPSLPAYNHQFHLLPRTLLALETSIEERGGPVNDGAG
jgi:hypothetical protein